jgi:hypothetical protein
MRQFLLDNRADLIERCKAKVAKRPRRAATPAQLANGVPMFNDQLVRTLGAEEEGLPDESVKISGASGGDTVARSEIGVSAAAHGGELLRLGFTVDAVVHDYGEHAEVRPVEVFDAIDACLRVHEGLSVERGRSARSTRPACAALQWTARIRRCSEDAAPRATSPPAQAFEPAPRPSPP